MEYFLLYNPCVFFSDEFDIIPSVKLENISCPFVLDGTKLGIFSWCVKELFQYVYANLMEAKKAKCVMMKKEGDVLPTYSLDYRVSLTTFLSDQPTQTAKHSSVFRHG